MDDAVISAATGTAFTGVAGGTSTALPAGQIITEAGTGRLTIAKLRQAKEILDLADVDPSLPRYIVVGPKQITDLLGTTEVTSSDFNTVKALASGDVNSFLGFNFVVSNRLSVASSIRDCIAFVNDDRHTSSQNRPHDECERDFFPRIRIRRQKAIGRRHHHTPTPQGPWLVYRFNR